MGKLTKDQIAEIKILNLNGATVLELASRFNVSKTTIIYHLDRSWGKTHKEENKAYQRGYMRNRYQNDAEFRQRIKDTNNRCAKRRRERLKEIKMEEAKRNGMQKHEG